VVTAPQLDFSVAAWATVPTGSSGSSAASNVAMATRVTSEKETVDAAAVKKATYDVAMVKKAVDDAATVKKAADNAVMVRKVADEAAVMKMATDDAAAAKKAADDAMTVGSSSSSAPSAGAKRAAAPSGSTPPAKRRFLDSWKPRYVVQTFICHFLYCIYDFDLVLLAYSVPSSGRSPPSGGSNIAGAPKAGEPLDTVEAHCSKGSTSGAVGGDGVPVSGATIAVGAAALEVVVGDGSPAPEVSPEGDTNVTTGATTAGDPIAKTGLVGGVSPSTAVADDNVTMEESGCIL
jgi:hypothetical protein